MKRHEHAQENHDGEAKTDVAAALAEVELDVVIEIWQIQPMPKGLQSLSGFGHLRLWD